MSCGHLVISKPSLSICAEIRLPVARTFLVSFSITKLIICKRACVLELLLPTETFHFLSQFHFVNVIYTVILKNAKYAYRVGANAAAISSSVYDLNSDKTQT